jgi:hypothetical protein
MKDVLERCAACRADLSESPHDPDCQNRPLTKAELERSFKHRPGKPKKVETRDPETGRVEYEAYQVTPQENLETVLASPLNASMAVLLQELAALVACTSAAKAVQTDKEGGKTASTPMVNRQPAWAARKLDQSAQRLLDEAYAVAAWVNRPFDPHARPGDCQTCGGRPEPGDLFCAMCGEPTLRAFKRCGLCSQPRKDCLHTYRDLEDAGLQKLDMSDSSD